MPVVLANLDLRRQDMKILVLLREADASSNETATTRNGDDDDSTVAGSETKRCHWLILYHNRRGSMTQLFSNERLSAPASFSTFGLDMDLSTGGFISSRKGTV